MFDEELKKQLSDKFSSELKGDVKLILFGQENEGTFCRELEEFTKEISSLSGKLSYKSYPISSPERAKHGVERAPSLVIYSKENDVSATFCGVPGNHFFVTFVEDIVDASRGSPRISGDLLDKAKSINFPVKLMVFVSQSCPYCPSAVKAAHDISLSNPKVKAEMVDASLFRQLAQRFMIMGVPKTVINNKSQVAGATPLSELISQILSVNDKP
ncbi:MAG: protein disulfide oxidoreductase [Candidatus Micrarchaeia archaeon]